MFNVVLVAPEIPGNTGSIGRTCVATGCRLILIRPYGFNLDEKSVRRAGLDYWKYVDLVEYDSFSAFLNAEKPKQEQLFFYSKYSSQNYYDAGYTKNCYLIFGSETKGLEKSLFEKYEKRFFTVPMFTEKIRSLNLANVVTAVVYEGIRKI